MTTFREDFDGTTLDRPLVPPLPAGRELAIRDGSHLSNRRLEPSIVHAGRRRPVVRDEHPEPIRVSGMATGNWSGPVGSSAGQQRFAEGLEVREEQTRFEGWLTRSGRVAVRCRMAVSHRSMGAVWLARFEDRPEHSGELCVVEVIGHTIESGSAAAGGVKQFYDPMLVHDFVSPRLDIDVSTFLEYSVEWSTGVPEFAVDGLPTHRTRTAPAYPDDHPVPELEIDWVVGAGD